jgi:HK97 family phage portal protein
MAGALLQRFINKYVWETRSEGTFNLENPNQAINGFMVDQILGGGGPVSYNDALTLSAFYRAIIIKSGVISSIPYKLYKKTANGRQEVKPSEHPVAAMFAKKVNPKTTKVVYMERLMGFYDIKGRHFARIIFNSFGQAVELVELKYADVTPVETDRKIVYKVLGFDKPLSSDEVIDISNFDGKGVLAQAQKDFELQMGTRDYGSKFFSGGGKPMGLFIPKGVVSDAQREAFLIAYKKQKMRNSDVALPQGWDYKELSVTPAEAGFLGAAQASVADVSRWTGVPLYKLADMSAATRNNVEQQSIEFLQDTMGPIGTKIEAEHNTKLLTLPSEADMYLELNWDAYIKTDTATKAEAFAKYIQNAIKTPNEVRALNNDPSLPNADKLLIQGATVPLDVAEQMGLNKSNPPQARSAEFTEDELLEMLMKITNGRK